MQLSLLKKQAMIDKQSLLTDNENRYQLKIKECHNETFKKRFGPNWYHPSSWFHSYLAALW